MKGILNAAVLCYLVTAQSADTEIDPKLLMLLNNLRVETGQSVEGKPFIRFRISALERQIRRMEDITNLTHTAMELVRKHRVNDTFVKYFVPSLSCVTEANSGKSSLLGLDTDDEND